MKKRKEQETEERAKREAEERAARWEKICPALFKKTDPARLPQNVFKKVMDWHYGPRGLLLWGGTGVGKTRCMFCLLRRLLDEGCEILRFLPGQFEDRCVREYRDGEGPEWLRAVMQYEVVFFDDLFKCRVTPRVESALFQVFDYRHAEELPVLATTNKSSQEILKTLSDDVAEPFLRRIRESMEIIHCGIKPNEPQGANTAEI